MTDPNGDAFGVLLGGVVSLLLAHTVTVILGVPEAFRVDVVCMLFWYSVGAGTMWWQFDHIGD